MKLIYDMRILSPKMHGMTRYGLELLKAILDLDPDLGVGVLVKKPEDGKFLPKDSRIVVLACGLSPYGPRAQFTLPKILNAIKPDIYHCPFFGPPYKFKGPMAITLHDLIHLRFAKDYGLKQKLYYRYVVGPAARKARVVFTVSEHSKKDIVELLGVDPEKILITPNGVDKRFKPLDSEEKRKAIKSLGVGENYILGVGNPKPHKNLKSLIKAYGFLKEKFSEKTGPLVLVGVGKDDFKDLDLPSDVIFKSSLDDDNLHMAYGAAKVVVMPSLYEGFGLPALEAMASGAPVIASNKASLPEVVEDAGILTDPDPDALFKALVKVYSDDLFCRSIAEKGPSQALKFTWQASAKTALKAFKAIYEKGVL